MVSYSCPQVGLTLLSTHISIRYALRPRIDLNSHPKESYQGLQCQQCHRRQVWNFISHSWIKDIGFHTKRDKTDQSAKWPASFHSQGHRIASRYETLSRLSKNYNANPLHIIIWSLYSRRFPARVWGATQGAWGQTETRETGVRAEPAY